MRSRRFNQKLALLLAILTLVWFFLSARGGFNPILIPLAVCFWAYGFAILFLLQWLRARWFQKPHPELPFGPASWTGHKTVLYVVLGFVALITGLRGGVLAPDFLLTFNWYSSNAKIHTQSNMSRSEQSLTGGGYR